MLKYSWIFVTAALIFLEDACVKVAAFRLVDKQSAWGYVSFFVCSLCLVFVARIYCNATEKVLKNIQDEKDLKEFMGVLESRRVYQWFYYDEKPETRYIDDAGNLRG